jgi:hypothetical protein
MNTIQVAEKSYNTYFGSVSKCVWFEVTDNYNYFSVELRIQRLQTNNVNIQISNYNSSNTNLWSKIYQLSSNPTIVVDTIKLNHVPEQNSQVYGVFNT